MAQKKTYRIEIFRNGGWHLSHTWWGMPKGKTDGALMVLDAMYGTSKYRAVCDQTGEVYREVGGRPVPSTDLDKNGGYWGLM